MTKKKKKEKCLLFAQSLFFACNPYYINLQLFPTRFLPFVGIQQQLGSDIFFKVL